MIKDSPSEIRRQETALDEAVDYISSCYEKLVPLIPVPPEARFEYLEGIDPIEFARIMGLAEAIDRRDISWSEFDENLQCWQAAWVEYLRRCYRHLKSKEEAK